MTSYETVFILTPVLSEDQAKEAVKKYESEIKSFGANLNSILFFSELYKSDNFFLAL